MDEIDEKILDILRDDGRASHTNIAEEVEVSEGTVRNRIDRMLEEGVIEKFTVKTASRGAKAVVMVELETGKDIEGILKDFPEQMNIKEVTGQYDLILEFERSSNKEINSLLDEVRGMDGIRSTETYMVLEERN